MSPRTVLLALAAALTVSACGATMVNAPGHAGAYGPVNDADRVGVIKFRDDDLLRDKRRQDAYKQMYKACDGKYTIVDEGESIDGKEISHVSSTKTTTDSTARSTTVYRRREATTDANSAAETNTSRSSTTVVHNDHYWVMQFRCVRDSSEAPAQ